MWRASAVLVTLFNVSRQCTVHWFCVMYFTEYQIVARVDSMQKLCPEV